MFRLEFTHFRAEIDERTTDIRFDIYRQPNEVSFKEGVDGMPEHDIDYTNAGLTVIKEQKSADDRSTIYYPTYELKFQLVRNPLQAIMNYLFPTIVLSIFIYSANKCDELADVLGTCSIATLALIALYQ